MAVRRANGPPMPADDPAAVEVHDGGQIEPALIGLDISNICEPDPVRRGSHEVAIEQVRGDRKLVPAIGGPHPAGPRHDGPDTVMAHQSLDAAAAHPAALGLQLDVNARAPAQPHVVPPSVATPNRAGQVLWPPTRSSGRSKPPDRPLAAYSRP